MTRIILLNAIPMSAFSSTFRAIPMHPDEGVFRVRERMEIADPDDILISYIGHPSTAALLSSLLNADIKPNRASYAWRPDDFVFSFECNVKRSEESGKEQDEVSLVRVWRIAPHPSV